MRSGAEYLNALASRELRVVVNGSPAALPIGDHPAFAAVARNYARLFDLQQADGTRFRIPRDRADVAARVDAASRSAQATHGLLRNAPDHAAAIVTAFAGSADWFAGADAVYAENVRAYHELIASRDLMLAHALALPQVNRMPHGSDQLGGQMAARVVDHGADGSIVLRGARLLATSGPLCDDILVLPATVLRGGAEESPYAFACAVPADAPGVRFQARATLPRLDPADYPLSSRYDEVDTMVVFDDVIVPAERVFLLGNPPMCNDIYKATGASELLTQQVLVRFAAKLGFYLGLAQELARALGVEQQSPVQERIAELIIEREALRTALDAATQVATENDWGMTLPARAPLDAARNRAGRAVSRLPALIADIAGIGMLTSPGASDLEGAGAEDIDLYYQGRFLTGSERVTLTRLAFDASASEFAARHAIADRLVFGEPAAMAAVLAAGHNAEDDIRPIRTLLAEAAGR